MDFPQCFFVTGTDTGVGKTVISALLAAGLEACYWKPVQSGAACGLDSKQVALWAGLGQKKIIPGVYTLQEPLSPHLAAKRQGVLIDPDELRIPDTEETLIIEGAGGIMVPLNDDLLILDWVRSLAVPVLIVAPNRLGVINHTLLTIKAIGCCGVKILGVILNGQPNMDHVQAIEHFGKTPVLAQVPTMPEITPRGLKSKFLEYFG
ncbi:dethiobiotin synthase [Desulfonatronospira sp.]|uniref:dethiobiotin synthase n=1 Tax=Desulfonatronospira sp. TaxID=1962951 RepID=UPI0025B950B0|nr:dethiobiotin synthase [Desulfonatronospira sp.]